MKGKKKLGLYIALLGILVLLAQIILTVINESGIYLFMTPIGLSITFAGLFTLYYQNRKKEKE